MPRTLLVYACSLALTAALCDAGPPPLPAINWDGAACADLPEVRKETAAVAVGDQIFLMGHDNGAVSPDDALVYDADLDGWSAIAPMPTARGQAAVTVADGRVYVFGGNNCFSNCWLTAAESYDPRSNTWTALTSMPTTDRGLATAVEFAGQIHVMGGSDSYDNPSIYDIHDLPGFHAPV